MRRFWHAESPPASPDRVALGGAPHEHRSASICDRSIGRSGHRQSAMGWSGDSRSIWLSTIYLTIDDQSGVDDLSSDDRTIWQSSARDRTSRDSSPIIRSQIFRSTITRPPDLPSQIDTAFDLELENEVRVP
jgi:hypothetical protein